MFTTVFSLCLAHNVTVPICFLPQISFANLCGLIFWLLAFFALTVSPCSQFSAMKLVSAIITANNNHGNDGQKHGNKTQGKKLRFCLCSPVWYHYLHHCIQSLITRFIFSSRCSLCRSSTVYLESCLSYSSHICILSLNFSLLRFFFSLPFLTIRCLLFLLHKNSHRVKVAASLVAREMVAGVTQIWQLLLLWVLIAACRTVRGHSGLLAALGSMLDLKWVKPPLELG